MSVPGLIPALASLDKSLLGGGAKLSIIPKGNKHTEVSQVSDKTGGNKTKLVQCTATIQHDQDRISNRCNNASDYIHYNAHYDKLKHEI